MEKTKITEKDKNINLIKIMYIVLSFAFITPSMVYILKNKTIFGFNKEFKFLLNNIDTVKQTIIYLIIISLLITIYFLIIKKRKQLFKDTKSVMKFILIVSLIFVFTVPMFSSDVFYYLGIGRLNSEYGQNPYYISMKQYVDDNNININADTVMLQGYNSYWAKTTVVYGPIWTIICAVVAKLSLGNIDFGLFVFKMVNLAIHMLNCYFIYKLSKKNIFVLLYGLNPFIILEGIINVHNDIFVVLLLLIALYFLIKKKKLFFSILFLAIATGIKYFTVLLLPFFIIYYYRKEKPLFRFIKCIEYGIVFAIIFIIPYFIYIRDINVFAGLWEQQSKVAKSLYLVLRETFKNVNYKITQYLLVGFAYIFSIKNLCLLFKPNIKIKKEMTHNLYFVMIFLFVLITNFQPWYIMWLFPLMIWQKASNIKLIVQTGLISMYANSVFLINGEQWRYGVYFYLILTTCMILFTLYNNKNKIIRRIKQEENRIGKTSFNRWK